MKVVTIVVYAKGKKALKNGKTQLKIKIVQL
jgi:hypothetical protein